MISGIGALFGTYTINAEGTTATLVTFKSYNEEDGYFYDFDEAYASVTITFDGSAYAMRMPLEDGTVIALTLAVANESPIRLDLPSDPNGNAFDPKYQVTQAYWDSIFDGEYLFNGIGNFTVNYSVPYEGAFMVAGDVFNDSNRIIHVRETWQPDQNGQYAFREYYSDGQGGWNNGSAYFDLVNWWDQFTGAIPAPFMRSTYSTTGHYYDISSFTYTPEGESRRSITNFRAYFENSKLMKIQYTKDGETFTFDYSLYGETRVTVPGENGQGGQGQGENGQGENGQGENGQGENGQGENGQGENGQGEVPETSIAHDYPTAATGEGWETWFAGDFGLTLHMYDEEPLEYVKKGDYLRVGERIYDLSDDGFVVIYSQEDGEWTVEKMAFDEDSVFSDKAHCLESGLSMIKNSLSVWVANTPGWEKSSMTYNRRQADVYIVEATESSDGTTYFVRINVVMDVRTGACLQFSISSDNKDVGYVAYVSDITLSPELILPEVDLDAGDESGEGVTTTIAEIFPGFVNSDVILDSWIANGIYMEATMIGGADGTESAIGFGAYGDVFYMRDMATGEAKYAELTESEETYNVWTLNEEYEWTATVVAYSDDKEDEDAVPSKEEAKAGIKMSISMYLLAQSLLMMDSGLFESPMTMEIDESLVTFSGNMVLAANDGEDMASPVEITINAEDSFCTGYVVSYNGSVVMEYSLANIAFGADAFDIPWLDVE